MEIWKLPLYFFVYNKRTGNSILNTIHMIWLCMKMGNYGYSGIKKCMYEILCACEALFSILYLVVKEVL